MQYWICQIPKSFQIWGLSCYSVRQLTDLLPVEPWLESSSEWCIRSSIAVYSRNLSGTWRELAIAHWKAIKLLGLRKKCINAMNENRCFYTEFFILKRTWEHILKSLRCTTVAMLTIGFNGKCWHTKTEMQTSVSVSFPLNLTVVWSKFKIQYIVKGQQIVSPAANHSNFFMARAVGQTKLMSMRICFVPVDN